MSFFQGYEVARKFALLHAIAKGHENSMYALKMYIRNGIQHWDGYGILNRGILIRNAEGGPLTGVSRGILPQHFLEVAMRSSKMKFPAL